MEQEENSRPEDQAQQTNTDSDFAPETGQQPEQTQETEEDRLQAFMDKMEDLPEVQKQALAMALRNDQVWLTSKNPELLGKEDSLKPQITMPDDSYMYILTKDSYEKEISEGGRLSGKEDDYKIATRTERFKGWMADSKKKVSEELTRDWQKVLKDRETMREALGDFERNQKAWEEAFEKMQKQMAAFPFHEFFIDPLKTYLAVSHAVKAYNNNQFLKEAKKAWDKKVEKAEKAFDVKNGTLTEMLEKTEQLAVTKKSEKAIKTAQKVIDQLAKQDHKATKDGIILDAGQGYFADPEEADTGIQATAVEHTDDRDPEVVLAKDQKNVFVKSNDSSLFPEIVPYMLDDGSLMWMVPEERMKQALESHELKGKEYTASRDPAKLIAESLKSERFSKAKTEKHVQTEEQTQGRGR